jgi:hypothetical protein
MGVRAKSTLIVISNTWKSYLDHVAPCLDVTSRELREAMAVFDDASEALALGRI